MDKKLIAIIALSVTSFTFMFSTVVLAVSLSWANQDFNDQVEVTRLVIQGFDSMTNMEFAESENYMDEATLLQQEILDRNGLDGL